MSTPGSEPDLRIERRAIARGAVVNGLGTAGKALMPVYLILATRLFGPAAAGLYYAAWVVIEVAISLMVSGFNAGVLMFTSRFLGSKEDPRAIYRVFANALVSGLGVSLVLMGVAHLGATTFLPALFPRAGYVEALLILSLSLPFTVIPVLVAAASKAHLTMKWDAIIQGFLPPVLLTLFVGGAYLLGFGFRGLLWGHLLAQVARTIISLVIFGHLFSYRELFAELRRFRWFWELFAFAIPQNLNMTFTTFITNVDVMMLAAFNVRPELVMFYGMGAQIARGLRQARMAFSHAFEPVVARLHGRGDRAGLSLAFTQVSRWATMVGLPFALVAVVFRGDLVQLFHGSFTGDTTFMLLLLIPPVLSCTFGIAGNIVVMTGHSVWNLVNSVTVAGLNAALNYLLIPPMGLNGAALATVISTTIITAMQLVEADRLVGARLRFGRLAGPYLASLAPAGLILWAHYSGWLDGFGGRLGVGIPALALFAATLWLLALDPEDRSRLFAKKTTSSGDHTHEA